MPGRATGLIAFLYEGAFTASGQLFCNKGGVDLKDVLDAYELSDYLDSFSGYFWKQNNVNSDHLLDMRKILIKELPRYLGGKEIPEDLNVQAPSGEGTKGERKTFPTGLVALLYDAALTTSGSLLHDSGVDITGIRDAYGLPVEMTQTLTTLLRSPDKLSEGDLIAIVNRILEEIQVRPSVIW